jgi:hypothetical protein
MSWWELHAVPSDNKRTFLRERIQGSAHSYWCNDAFIIDLLPEPSYTRQWWNSSPPYQIAAIEATVS